MYIPSVALPYATRTLLSDYSCIALLLTYDFTCKALLFENNYNRFSLPL